MRHKQTRNIALCLKNWTPVTFKNNFNKCDQKSLIRYRQSPVDSTSLHRQSPVFIYAICEIWQLAFSDLTWASVLWRCWLGGSRGIHGPVKTERWGAGVVICMELGADLHMAQLIPLPLPVSCISKSQIGFTFLVPAQLYSPRQRTTKCECLMWEWTRDGTSLG